MNPYLQGIFNEIFADGDRRMWTEAAVRKAFDAVVDLPPELLVLLTSSKYYFVCTEPDGTRRLIDLWFVYYLSPRWVIQAWYEDEVKWKLYDLIPGSQYKIAEMADFDTLQAGRKVP